MVSKAKNKNDLSNNILYLQEADAKALGIIEGSSQRVYIDGREVEVVFVDEHEVVPVSNEDRKIYQDAYRIAEKYLQASSDENSPAWNALVTNNASARRVQANNGDYEQMGNHHRFSFKGGWEKIKSIFKKGSSQNDYANVDFDYDDQASAAFNQDNRMNQRSMVRFQGANSSTVARSSNQYAAMNQRHAQHSIRNDVFTKEELEIIQNVIDKSKNYESNAAAANQLRPQQVTSNASKTSKIKTSGSKPKNKK